MICLVKVLLGVVVEEELANFGDQETAYGQWVLLCSILEGKVNFVSFFSALVNFTVVVVLGVWCI